MSAFASRPPRSFLLAACAATLFACKGGTQSPCTSSVQCAPGFSCNAATGACGCDNDSSCKDAESCNAAGFCQPRLRCESSADCASGDICDSPSGRCIPAGTCTIDVQCAQDEVCRTSDFTCVPGCRSSGDCRIDEVCRPCPVGTPLAQCSTGSLCGPGHCDSMLSCRYGELCAAPPGDPGGDTVCQKDTRGPFCGACTRPAGGYYCSNGSVPEPGNYCLIDTSVPFPQAFYCGVDCSQPGQECPNGYVCHDVRIVTPNSCLTTNGLSACAPPAQNPACDPARTHAGPGGVGLVNDDCEAVGPPAGPLVGAVCDPVTRRCAAQCLGTGETGVQAFCSCIEDADCPGDTCGSQRVCQISGKPCIPGTVPDECQSTQRIFCVKVSDPRLGEVGYCRIGQNCAPGEGFTCKILRGK